MKVTGFILPLALLLAACSQKNTLDNFANDDCIAIEDLYKSADQRIVEKDLFGKALQCSDPKIVKSALVALGRIGGEPAATLIASKLSDGDPEIRQSAAFSAGISLYPDLVPQLIQQFNRENNSDVRQALALAIGNLAHQDSAKLLYEIINNSQNDTVVDDTNLEQANGAMQGLAILALFHPDKMIDTENLKIEKVLTYLQKTETSLMAAFLLARVPLLRGEQLNVEHRQQVMDLLDDKKADKKLDADSKAFLIRAASRILQKDDFNRFMRLANDKDIGIRVSAIQALGKLPIDKNDLTVEQLQKINKLAQSDDVITAVTSLQSNKRWLSEETINSLIKSNNDWIASEAFKAASGREEWLQSDFLKALSKKWLASDQPNFVRAAAEFALNVSDQEKIKSYLNHSNPIVENTAKRLLSMDIEDKPKALATPHNLPELPNKMLMVTTRGDVIIQLFKDTPYTSANFVNIAKSGFYDGTYFHRVIPNFVAQGGSKLGDGNGNVGHSIREELSQRSHRYGTIGMATSGKDTGGGQFFFNLAPNLHLDSNYTIFGEVVDGMETVLKLEQNDKLVKVILLP